MATPQDFEASAAPVSVQPTSSDEPSDAAKSDDGPPGFEFHQMGELEHYDDEDLHGSMEEMALDLCSSTGY
ncbi:hypothetical protein NpNSSI1_00005407 [Neofusicoccum parvum]|nr:hypothetical protein NpNSSI1_00005407 [Neofusicoccum parvum]